MGVQSVGALGVVEMIDLEQKFGPMRLRAWGLVVNFVANMMALYGLSAVLAGRGGMFWLYGGFIGTVVCLAILARPMRD